MPWLADAVSHELESIITSRDVLTGESGLETDGTVYRLQLASAWDRAEPLDA